jgi:hypothetical protein
VADCARRHSGGGHDAVQHRCETKDADLNNPSATYYYEGYYLVSGDMVKHNNIGSRRTTMSWTGSGWNFSTPSSSNPLIEGPAIERWGDLRSEFGVAPGDGKAILASATTDLGGGQTHYEYALYNFDSYREVGKISIPVGETAVISNMEFHDWDGNAANDWTMTLANGYITWETTPFVSDSTANAVTFGMLMNFRFDANVPPSGTGAFAQLTPWRPGPVSSPKALTKVPATATSVPAIATTPTIRLGPARPNPLDPTTTIHFELSHESDATVEVFGAEGRRVRTLQTGRLSAGAHQLVWDGTDSDGTRVAPGVYYYRLTAGSEMAAQSLVVIR